MAASRKLRLPSLLLVCIALIGGVSLFILLFNLQKELEQQKSVFREDNFWGATQLEREARVFRHHLFLYTINDGNITSEMLNRRFDVLWSRIESMDKGELGRLYIQLEGAGNALESGRKMLRKIDPLLRQLLPGDIKGSQGILAELDPFVESVFKVSKKAVQQTLTTQEERKLSFEQTSKITLFLVAGIFFSGMVLFFILLRNQYHLDQFTHNLEDLVRERTAELEQSSQNLKMMSQAIEQSPVSVVICNEQGRIQYVNSTFVEITGYTHEEALGKNPRFLQSGRTSAVTYKEMWQTVHADKVWKGEICNKKKNGEIFWEHVSLSPIKDSNEQTSGYLAVKEDISQRKIYEEQLVKQANYDGLTGLPNRTLAMDRLNQAILQVQRRGGSVALLFIDLDNFKLINDTFGHDYGDIVLQRAAKRFLSCLRDCDTAARFGGDEFLIILSEIQGYTDVERIITRILESFASPFDFEDSALVATTSIGVSMCPQDGTGAADLLKFSDSAMYIAKNQGKNTYCFYNAEELA